MCKFLSLTALKMLKIANESRQQVYCQYFAICTSNEAWEKLFFHFIIHFELITAPSCKENKILSETLNLFLVCQSLAIVWESQLSTLWPLDDWNGSQSCPSGPLECHCHMCNNSIRHVGTSGDCKPEQQHTGNLSMPFDLESSAGGFIRFRCFL